MKKIVIAGVLMLASAYAGANERIGFYLNASFGQAKYMSPSLTSMS